MFHDLPISLSFDPILYMNDIMDKIKVEMKCEQGITVELTSNAMESIARDTKV